MELMFYFFIYLIYLVLILVAVAFITLLEQKILGKIQIRQGPIWVGYYGLLQSFADAVKLLNKESVKMWQINYSGYMLCPVISLVMSLMLWPVTPLMSLGVMFKFSVLYFMCLSGLSTYPIILSGWVSNCKYSMLGSLRSVAQMISYEISFSFLMMVFIFFYFSLSLEDFLFKKNFSLNMFYFLPFVLMWLVCMLAETNRTPYDFSESESELVSGYNTEFSSGGFTLLFMSEYSSIMFMSLLFSFIFLNFGMVLMMVVGGFFLMIYFIWVRASLARTRYDKLMFLAWKNILPNSLLLMSVYLFLNILFIS